MSSSPPSHPTEKLFHRAGSERGQRGPRLLPARAPSLPPVPGLLWLAQGGERSQGTQCGSLFPSSACWNWPISCLGLGAYSKVNKQIQRSWGLGWRKGSWGFPSPAPHGLRPYSLRLFDLWEVKILLKVWVLCPGHPTLPPFQVLPPKRKPGPGQGAKPADELSGKGIWGAWQALGCCACLALI